jgi:uncharacterized protein (DUF2147 family)
MWNALKLAVIAAGLLAAAPTFASAQDLAPTGNWFYPDKRFELAIVPCGAGLCGRIAWLQSPQDASGRPRLDYRNPDPTLRTRPLLGLTVLDGLHQTADGTWEGGKIYNPDDGASYSANVALAGDGTLKVRAYEVMALIGKTIVLTRAS